MLQYTENTVQQELVIPSGRIAIEGHLSIPERAQGLVIFAHGSGSSRHSPRNRYVAQQLQNAGLATLLMDLLTEEESESRSNVFDIDLLAERIGLAAAYLRAQPVTKVLPIGLFGASTGAGAALVAAAGNPEIIKAVVSRGGRPDLAGSSLTSVICPTLLIVGGFDHDVINLNREAQLRMSSTNCELVIVPGATHLFEEPGTLEEVARLARDWFYKHLVLSESA